MSNIAISVVVPCFNYGRYLTDAIYSLYGGKTSLGHFAPQSIRDFETIIVDDASEDDTREVAKPFVYLNQSISYIRNETNLGTAATLNVGIKQAGGKYITFLSADDMMETTRLEKLYQAAEANPHRVVYDDLAAFKDGVRTDKLPMPDYDFERLLYKNTMAAGILYLRSAWQEVGGYPESFRDGREDWAFGVLLGSFGYCGVHVKEPLYLYRREGQNRSLNNGGAEGRLKWLAKMQAQFPALYRGERSTMCCGSKSKRAANVSTSNVSASKSTPSRGGRFSRVSRGRAPSVQVPRVQEDLTVGVMGMALLEYQIAKAPVVFIGAVTNQKYTFGGSRVRGYVDARDAPALLERFEKRRHAFVQIQTEQEPPAPAPESPMPQTEKIIETVTLTIAPESVAGTSQPTKKPKKVGKIE